MRCAGAPIASQPRARAAAKLAHQDAADRAMAQAEIAHQDAADRGRSRAQIDMPDHSFVSSRAPMLRHAQAQLRVIPCTDAASLGRELAVAQVPELPPRARRRPGSRAREAGHTALELVVVSTKLDAMKRSIRKLVIRRETIRTLTQLDLVLAAGGNPNAQLVDTEGAGTGCPFVHAAALSDKP